MKRFNFCLSLILFFLLDISIYAQTVQWAKKGISEGYEYGNAIVADDSGNTYVSGQIEYTTDFGNISLSSYGIHDIFVGKYDRNGNIRWLKHAGGTSGDVGYGVGIDASYNCYVSGEIELTSGFGSGISLTSAGSNDIVLAKYDRNGNIIWAKKWGSSGNDKSRAMVVSPAGDCYITGYISGTTSFGSTQLSSSGGNDIFVAKINSSGNVVWAKKAGGGNEDRGYGIAIDNSGNVFVTGVYNGNAVFSGTTVSNSGTNSAFLAKYDANGSFQWVKTGGSCCTNTESNCVAVDESGFIYTAGYFIGTTDFGSNHFSSAGSADIVITKYSQSGNVIWAKRAGGSYEDIAYGICIDSNADLVYVTGQIDESGYFGSHYAGGAGNRDVFLTALDFAGNFQWAKCYGGSERDIGYAIANDRFGNIFTTGIFNNTASFGSFVLSGYDKADFYIEKISPPISQQPTNQTSGLIVRPVNCSDLELTFNPGNGSQRLIVARANSAISEAPVDGNTYSANPVFGLGSNLGNGNYVVYNGAGNSVTVYGLNAGTTYSFAIFEYNGWGVTCNYLSVAPAAATALAGTVSINIVASSNSICAGDSTSISVTGAAVYSWSPLNGLSSGSGDVVIATPSSTTTYSVTGTDANGCIAQKNITISVNQNPQVSFGQIPSVCSGDPSFVLTGGLPVGGTYQGDGVTGNMFDPAIFGAGNYLIQYTYSDINGCTDSAQSAITVNARPELSFGILTGLCENSQPIQLNNASPQGGIYSGNGVTSGLFDPSIGNGTYTISYNYTDSLGCSVDSVFNIVVNPIPVFDLGNDTIICSYHSILLNIDPVFATYNWSTGETGSYVVIDSSGVGLGTETIYASVGNSYGCFNNDSIMITFDLCSGIEDNQDNLSGVSVYPNPFDEFIFITSTKAIKFSIYDCNGKLILEEGILPNTFLEIPGRKFSPGIYFIQLLSESYSKTILLIKL